MNNKDTVEKAFAMYTENVSPSREHLRAILSQIPEQQTLKERRAVRSPYRWLVFTQVASLCLLIAFVYPASLSTSENPDYYFYDVDRQVEQFEKHMYEDGLSDDLY